MVCAPTNKAVAVLARRFLDSIQDDSCFSVLLVGDADKLLTDERNDGANSSSSLQSIFLYSWMDSMVDKYKDVLAFFRHKRKKRDTDQFQTMCRTVHALESRLKQNLPDLPESVVELFDAISITLGSVEFGGSLQGIAKDIEALVQELQSLTPEPVFSQVRSTSSQLFTLLNERNSLITWVSISTAPALSGCHLLYIGIIRQFGCEAHGSSQ